MSWSLRIGRIAGIPIFLHWTFLVLIGWLLLEGLGRGRGIEAALLQVGFVLALFGCVVLHELGHALAARRYGVPTADITLLPIGGVARLQRIPEKPAEELVVALAGPAMNVVIAAALYLLGARAVFDMDHRRLLVQKDFASELMAVNLILFAFNLIPAFPMDGGRVLRAGLALAMDYGRATAIAANIGQVIAIGFAFAGLGLFGGPGNIMLLFIALFVWIGAQGEAAQVVQRLELEGLPVRAAMLTDFASLRPDDPLGRAAELLLAGTQQDFPVEDAGRIVGVLTRAGLMAGLVQGGRDAPVSSAPIEESGTVEADAPLVPALTRLRDEGVPCLQVIEGGRPVGLLTQENVGEFLMIRLALGSARGRPAPA